MISNNAKLRATIEETPPGQENIITLAHSGETIAQSDVKYVFDYYGPTGRYSEAGLIRHATQNDFRKIIDENLDFKIQKNNEGEFVLHYIEP